MKTLINNVFDSWVMQFFIRRMPAARDTILLNSSSTYILPTRYGIYFFLTIFIMFLGATNYSNNMGFLLTFLLIGIFLIGMLHTYRNLVQLSITAMHAQSVFAGDTALFRFKIKHSHGDAISQIACDTKKSFNSNFYDISENGYTIADVKIGNTQRGKFTLNRIRLWTIYPLGLFHVWSWINPNVSILIYPKPDGNKKLFSIEHETNTGDSVSNITGHDDYIGMREYQPTDSPKHIAWKALAHSHLVLTKQFTGLSDKQLWLEWDTLRELETEARLSQLCKWILECHHKQQSYGLKLPNLTIEPNIGDLHKKHCLEALALFSLDN